MRTITAAPINAISVNATGHEKRREFGMAMTNDK
jgi:hypothetical protein